MRHVLRERLVEPEVVPPLHRHEVAEPHVRHLVADRVGARQQLVAGGRPAVEVLVAEGDAARVLHRARVELGHEDLVVLPERVADAEEGVEVVERPLRHVEDLGGVPLERLAQRRAGVDAEGYAVVLVVHGDVGPSAHRHEVGGERLRRLELPRAGRRLGRRAVADHRPPERGPHDDVVGRLEVGLVEARVDAGGRVEEEVPVDVVALVGGVGGPVQALPVVAVGHRRGDDELVVAGEPGERQPPVDDGGGVEVGAVEADGSRPTSP